MDELVAEVNHQAGTALQVVGVAEQGQSGGAVFVRWPDGRGGVVSRSPLLIDEARQTAEVLSEARSQGLPVPRHEVLVELGASTGGGVAVVQERLPGRPARRTDVRVVEAMLDLNEQFAGLLAERSDVRIPLLYLHQSGPVVPRHEVLEQYSDRSRRLLSSIREVGAQEMVGDDLVHPDFTVPNVLFDEAGRITGVVDWNLGVLRGDRRWALIKLRFDLTWAAAFPGGDQGSTQAEAIERVDAAIDSSLEPDLLQAYWAHWTLVQLHWAILHHPPEVIDLHLALGERRLRPRR